LRTQDLPTRVQAQFAVLPSRNLTVMNRRLRLPSMAVAVDLASPPPMNRVVPAL